MSVSHLAVRQLVPPPHIADNPDALAGWDAGLRAGLDYIMPTIHAVSADMRRRGVTVRDEDLPESVRRLRRAR